MKSNTLYIKSSEFIQSTHQTNNIHNLDLPVFFVFFFWKYLVFYFITRDPDFLPLCAFDFTASAKPCLCFAFFYRTCNECICIGRPLATAWRLPLPDFLFLLGCTLIFLPFPFFIISSDPKLKTAVTRFECIVEDVERAATLFENFKIPLARFGSFVLLGFWIICSHDLLSASAAKSMHASSVSTCWPSHINSSSNHEGDFLGWMAGSFSEHKFRHICFTRCWFGRVIGSA